MKTYIGTKIVQAEPAKRYWLEDGEKIFTASNEMMAAEMLSVATACEDGYKVIYKDGYESWSPKEVFEEAYRPANGINFGLAIEAAKQGKKNFKKKFFEVKNEEMLRYDLGEDFSIETAAVFGELYKHNGEWKFNAIGQGTTDRGLNELAKRYM